MWLIREVENVESAFYSMYPKLGRCLPKSDQEVVTGSVAYVNLFNLKCHKMVQQMLGSSLFLGGCRCIGMHCKINLSLTSLFD